MEELPIERVRPGKLFARSDVDYAGPISIKWRRGTKTLKGYIVVFVCLATKAVHFELLRRFVARKGMAHILLSDNGTNFIEANKIYC